jgi:hypothetical protein
MPIRNPVLEGLLGAGQDVTKNLDPAEFDPWIVAPVASRYIDYAVPEFMCLYILNTRL